MLHNVKCSRSALAGVHVVEIASNRRFPRHAHDQYGVGVMLDGGHVSWSGRGQVEAGPGHVITVNPDEMHDGIPFQGSARRWCMMFVDPCVITGFSAWKWRDEFPLPVIDAPRLARQIFCALQDFPDITAVEATERVLDLFGALLGQPENARPLPRLSCNIQRIVERIHDDPVNAPSLVELASIAGLAPYTMLRRFRRELGTTPHAYLLQYRVRKACKAISEGRTLTDAAFIAGFADQPHMTRVFVRQLGMTPGQWRSA